MTEIADAEPPRAMILTGSLATRDGWNAAGCPAAAALDVVGTRSALLIVREALYGTTRFDDFARRVGITEAVTSARLRELTELGVFRRVPYREPGRRTRYEYRLTQMGADLAPVVLALFEWGSAYLRPDGKLPFDMLHRKCDAPVRAELVCDEGHRVPVDEIYAQRPRRR